MNPTLPKAFIERLQTILTPDRYQQFVQALQQPKRTAFRVNTLLADPSEVVQHLEMDCHPISWCPNAYFICESQKRALTESHFFKEGKIYIQNPSSLFATLVLDPQTGEEILDLAAAPGGKTLHIAALMNNIGRIAAVEAVRDRFFRLLNNVKLAGANIVATYHKDGTTLGRIVPARFDRVLLDSPCSAEARFNPDDPKSFAFWSEKKILEMNRKQKKLIYSAIQCLKPNGTLVYCTCSYAPEENEAIVQYALNKFGGELEIQAFDTPFSNYQVGLTQWQNTVFSSELQKSIRIIPNELMAGFYICKILKKS